MRLGRIVALFEEVGGCGLVHGRPLAFFLCHAIARCSAAFSGAIQRLKQVEIDIAAAQNETDALAFELVLLLQGGRERCRAGAFGEIVGVGPVRAHRRGNFVVRDLRNPRSTLADDRKRIRVRHTRRDAVGERIAAVGAHHRTGRKRQRVGRRFGRLHPDDFGLKPQQVARQNAAADAGAEANRDIKHVEIAGLYKQFERIGRNPQHQIGMEGRHEFQPVTFGSSFGLLAGGLKVMAVFDQVGAESSHRAVLLDRVAVRGVDRHRHAVAAACECQTLAVIARRRRNQPREHPVARASGGRHRQVRPVP